VPENGEHDVQPNSSRKLNFLSDEPRKPLKLCRDLVVEGVPNLPRAGTGSEDVVSSFHDAIARRAEALLKGFDVLPEEVGPGTKLGSIATTLTLM